MGEDWAKEFGIIEPVRLAVAEDVFYDAWTVENSPNPSLVEDSVRAFQYRPRVSVVMPLFNADPEFLREAIESVEAQVYQNWELCICDNGSTRLRHSRARRLVRQRRKSSSGLESVRS